MPQAEPDAVASNSSTIPAMQQPPPLPPDRPASIDDSGQLQIQLRVLALSRNPLLEALRTESIERVEGLDEARLQLGRSSYDVVAVDLSGQESMLALEAIGARAPQARARLAVQGRNDPDKSG